MGKKKILYYNRALNSPEGPSIHARALLDGLLKSHDVRTYPEPRDISYVKQGGGGGRRAFICEWGIEVLRAARGLFYSLRDFCLLSRMIVQERPDFILTRSSGYSISTPLLRIVWRTPVIMEVNGLLYNERKALGLPSLTWLRKVFEKWGIESSDVVYVVSDELVGELEAAGMSYKQIATIANGVDLDKFNLNVSPREIKQNPAEVIVGFTGSLYPWHGVDVLIEAMDLIRKVHGNVRLVIAGDGVERRGLEKLVAERGLESLVVFLGSVAHMDIPAVVSCFDIAVAPYNPKGLFYFSPLKVYEYMAMGKPVVGSELGQLVSLFEKGDGGLLVPPGNPQELADAIMQLVVDGELRKSMGELNSREAYEKHSWDVAVAKVVTLFDEVGSGSV